MSPSLQTMGFFMSDINFCNTKEQLNHLGEVVTGKVDGSPTGADIDTSTLPYTGQVRKTLPALENEYEQSITNKEIEADAAIDSYRLLNKGPYASGITLESKFEYITYNGESYFAVNPPYTTTSTTPDADGNLFLGGYVNESLATQIAETVLEENISDYTDIVYKASGGNSAVENMFNESPLSVSIGDILRTGGTSWEKISESSPLDENNFRAFNAFHVNDFGAKSDGSAPALSSVQSALTTAAKKGGGIVVFSPNGSYDMTGGTALFAQGTSIDFQGCELLGDNSNVMFESGYLDGGIIVSNINTPNESNRITRSIISGRGCEIRSSLLAFNLKNFNEASTIKDITFKQCIQSIHTRRSFYGRYLNLHSSGNFTQPAYVFEAAFGACEADQLFVDGRDVGFSVIGPSNGIKFTLCSAENVQQGVVVTNGGDAGSLVFDTCYFENASVAAFDFQGSQGVVNVSIVNPVFNNTAKSIRTDSPLRSGCLKNAFFGSGANEIDLGNSGTFMDVDLDPRVISDNTLPGEPASPSISIGNGTSHVKELNLLRSTDLSGEVIHKNINVIQGVIPFHFTGSCGRADANSIPFCVTTKVDIDGNNYRWEIETGIEYDQDVMTVLYSLRATDNSGSKRVKGFVMGDRVIDSIADATITATDNSGFLKLTITGVSSPTLAGSIRGVVKII